MSLKNATTTALAASLVVTNEPANLFHLTLFNGNVGAQYLQIHDSATLPADTAVPVVVVKLAAGATYDADFGYRGRPFSNGITVCNSSTGATKTIGTTDCWISATLERVAS